MTVHLSPVWSQSVGAAMSVVGLHCVAFCNYRLVVLSVLSAAGLIGGWLDPEL